MIDYTKYNLDGFKYRTIMLLLQKGESRKDIAGAVGISVSTLGRIIHSDEYQEFVDDRQPESQNLA